MSHRLQPQPQEQAFLQAIVETPNDEGIWLVLADWLEEHDDPRRAELLRLHRRLLATCCEPDEHPERAGWQTRIVELLGQGIKPAVPQKTILLGERARIPMAFSFIPPGSFLMGSPTSEEGRNQDETLHRVELSSGFWLGVHPVTQAQWRRVTGSNPSRFKGVDTRPVDHISWDDCQVFCELLEEKTGWRFRLPTEAEWESTCRAATTTAFSFGGTISTDQANDNGEDTYGGGATGVYRQQTTPVGSFPANAWGLFDMHGNLWEWCQDGGSDARGLRGGSWYSHPDWCRSAYRRAFTPSRRGTDFGCRLVCLD